MFNSFLYLWRDDGGASAAEYALILGIIGAGIVASTIALSTSISNAIDDAGSCVETPVSDC